MGQVMRMASISLGLIVLAGCGTATGAGRQIAAANTTAPPPTTTTLPAPSTTSVFPLPAATYPPVTSPPVINTNEGNESTFSNIIFDLKEALAVDEVVPNNESNIEDDFDQAVSALNNHSWPTNAQFDVNTVVSVMHEVVLSLAEGEETSPTESQAVQLSSAVNSADSDLQQDGY